VGLRLAFVDWGKRWPRSGGESGGGRGGRVT
jgi:hypothetical protein